MATHHRRPLIAVSAALEPRPTAFGEKDVTLVTAAYTNALYAAGGQPVVMPVVADPPAGLLSRMDGLLLTGGADLDPALYGAEPDSSTYGVRRERDDFEAALYAEARAAGLPIFAICRGMQLVNVVHEGKLILDLRSDTPHWQTGPADTVSHGVDIEPGSALAAAIGAVTTEVNSYHHQGWQTVGTGLRVTGRCGDVIEAAESLDGQVLAVQWHPEHLAATHPQQAALFEAFVARAAAFADTHTPEERELCPTT